MSRPVVWKCDGCGKEARTDDYGLPIGWVRVKAMEPHAGNRRAEAEGEFCIPCSLQVDARALAGTGRLFDSPKPTKRKAKAKPQADDLGPDLFAPRLEDDELELEDAE